MSVESRMDPLSDVLAQARATAAEEVNAVCADAAGRMRDVLAGRLGAVESQLHQVIESVRKRARGETTETLNNAMRRLKQADSRDVWVRTLLDTAAQFCGEAALFQVTGTFLHFEGAHGRDAGVSTEIPLAAAPAFREVVESKDTVVAAGTPGELSEAAVAALTIRPANRVYLLPIVQRQKTFAVLYAEADRQGQIDLSALELLCSLAAATMDAAETISESKPEDLIRIAGVMDAASAPAPAKPVLPELSRSDQDLHLRAQRFARIRMAELVLRRMAAIRQGRASGNLYATLKDEIDAGRQTFRRQFIETCPSMVDYYHIELVKTLAKDDAALLGPGYPGPLP